MSDARDEWDGRGIAVAVIVAALVATWESCAPEFWSPRPLGFVWGALGAAAIASCAVSLVQLLGAVAGRGRALPGTSHGRRFIAAIVVVLSIAICTIYAWAERPWMSVAELAVESGTMAASTIAVFETLARLGGPGLIAIWATVTLAFAIWFSPFAALCGLVSIVYVLRGLRRLDLGPSRLAALGITPWAPSDLSVIPLVALLGWSLVRSMSHPVEPRAIDGLIILSIAHLEVVSLAYVDAWLRLAEERADSRAG